LRVFGLSKCLDIYSFIESPAPGETGRYAVTRFYINDQKRIDLFADNLRDGFKFDPIEVQIHPEDGDKYRILDGAHRWHAYKETGATEIEAVIKKLGNYDPLLYAAKKAIGPLQLTEEEARKTPA